MPINPVADYSDFKQDSKPSDEAFFALNAAVEEAKTLHREIAQLTAQLEAKKKQLNGVLFTRLPAMMDEMGLSEFKTAAGLEVKVKEEIESHIRKDNTAEAFKWLEENGHGGLIKREIKVAFNKDQQEAADKLMAELAGRFAGLGEKKVVHPQTLKAWVREMLGKGASVPMDTFGVRRIRVAKIPDLKPPKSENDATSGDDSDN